MSERNYLKTEAVFLAEKTPKKEVVVTPPLREDSLTVTENGTYQAPIGRGYTDVEVNVQELPEVTSEDNGKVLGVVNGEWAKTYPQMITLSQQSANIILTVVASFLGVATQNPNTVVYYTTASSISELNAVITNALQNGILAVKMPNGTQYLLTYVQNNSVQIPINFLHYNVGGGVLISGLSTLSISDENMAVSGIVNIVS